MLLSLWCCLAFALCRMPWKQMVPHLKLVGTPLLSICRALPLRFFCLWLFTLFCYHSAYLLLHISTLLSRTWLMTVWYLSRVPSVPWYALLCHCCCPVSLFLFLLLLHPGSQPTLTYVSASDALIFIRTIFITMFNCSPTLLDTFHDPPEHPHPLPQTYVSLHPTLCPPPPAWQDFLGQVYCTLGEIVGSPASRLEKPLG